MKNKPISDRLYSIIVLYEMHTDFLISALDGIGDEDAQKRLDTQANHIAWITGSIVAGRYELAKSFGINLTSFTGALFAEHKGIEDGVIYPSLDDFKKDWAAISPVLQTALTEATNEKIDEPFVMPGMEMKLFDMIAFNTYREANCIGQIALWRRLLGYKAMNYM
ncbi:DinB family protein [Pedobacter punctiformis]|uniref:DinB family protein n=1 Tax=Pedobacter punctiformis TaxID=3004097 RepID=A0ABT4L8L7_9SPHI|nr:DinB family protein [Pedobacter sp. HCMS5-2]MCZ4244275.1 DinB family protein [Pedobacter sp. HCMS5-2]